MISTEYRVHATLPVSIPPNAVFEEFPSMSRSQNTRHLYNIKQNQRSQRSQENIPLKSEGKSVPIALVSDNVISTEQPRYDASSRQTISSSRSEVLPLPLRSTKPLFTNRRNRMEESSTNLSASHTQQHELTAGVKTSTTIYPRNRQRDRDLVSKLAKSSSAVLTNHTQPQYEENTATIRTDFDEDDLDPNTLGFEKLLVKAAERDIDENRLNSAKRGVFRGYGSAASTSDDSKEGRDQKARRLLDRLSRYKRSQARPASASDIDITKLEFNDPAPQDVTMRRSQSSSSTDSRRKDRLSPILALGNMSPSRRRRLGSQTSPQIARHKLYGRQEDVRRREASTLQSEELSLSEAQDPTMTATIDWLAAAAESTVREDFRPVEFTNLSNDTFNGEESQSYASANNDSHGKYFNSGPISKRLKVESRSYKPISTTPRISVIDEMTEPPSSSVVASTSKVPPTFNPPKQDIKSEYKDIFTGTPVRDLDETRDILRLISRATSTSPDSSSYGTTEDAYQNAQHVTKTIPRNEINQDAKNHIINKHEKNQSAISTNKKEESFTRIQQRIANMGSYSGSVRNTRVPMGDDMWTRAAPRPDSPSKSEERLVLSANVMPQNPLRQRHHSSKTCEHEVDDRTILPAFISSPTRRSIPTAPSSLRKHQLHDISRDFPKHELMKVEEVKVETADISFDSTFYPEEDYDTDDSLDRLLANDTDFSSLLRSERFEDESFLQAATIHIQPAPPSSEQRKRELAVQAKYLSRLHSLELEIRTARKGIDLIERKIAMEDDEYEDSPTLLDIVDAEVRRKTATTIDSISLVAKSPPAPWFRLPTTFLGWFGLILLTIFCLLLIEFKMWNDTLLPLRSQTIGTKEWFEKYPPGEYRPGGTVRWLWHIIKFIYSCFYSIFYHVSEAVSTTLRVIWDVRDTFMLQLVANEPKMPSAL